MKQPISFERFDTSNTDLSAALLALGFDLVPHNPVKRIFTDNRPCNNAVSHGLKRGGIINYYFDTKSVEFPESGIGTVAQAYTTPTTLQEGKRADFDEMLTDLLELTKGTEAGELATRLALELPMEIARYLRMQTDNRKSLLDLINTNREIPELLRLKKSDGNYALVSTDANLDAMEELL